MSRPDRKAILHEPTHPQSFTGGEQVFVLVLSVPLLGGVRGGFRVPNASEKAKGVFHEPAWPSNRSLSWESGAEDARTPNADASSADSAGARSVWSASDLSALAVRAGRRALHGRTARFLNRRGSP